jgi:glucose/arabinose dehydrogenase
VLRALPIALLALVLAAPADAAIRGPRGFDVQKVASGLGHPTAIAFDPAGGIWTTSAQYGVTRSDGVWYVKRRGAQARHVVSGLNTALGLTWFRGKLYVAHVVPYSASGGVKYTGRVTAYSRFNGRRFKRHRTIVKGIPTGQHRVNNIVPGPGGRLYMGVGSAADASAGSRFGGTVVSFKPGGGDLRIEARGLRNPYGLAFAPDGATLLVSDNGRDDLGNNRPPEELNRFVVTGPAPHFGFPRCWGRDGGRCSGTRAPFAELAPHSAVGGVAAVGRLGRFGPSAFVAEHGSTIASPPTGSVVRRVPLKSGRSDDVRFAGGFGRHEPLGLAIGPDGALYVTLHGSGRLIRFVP